MRFLKEFSITSVTSIVVTVLGLLNNIIITRKIGPDGRGIYSIISNIILLFGLVFGEGIRRSNTILMGRLKSNLNKLVNDTLIFNFFLAIIFLIIFYYNSLWKYFLPNISTKYFGVTLIISVFSILWLSYQALFLGLQKIFTYNLIQIVSVLSYFIITIIGIYFFNFDTFDIIFGLAISSLITGVVCLFIFFKDYNYKFKLNLGFFNRDYALLSQKSTLSAIEIFLLYKGDIFLINLFLGTVQTGLYSIAVIFSDFMHRISNIIGPLLISKTVNDRTDSIFYNTARVVRVIFFVNLLIVLMIMISGNYIIVTLFGNDFQFSFKILLFLLPGLFVFSPGSLLYAFFMGKGYPINIIIINAVTGILNILLNIFFIPKYGVLAAAIISSVTYLLWTICLIFAFRKESKLSLNEMIFIKKEDITYIYYSVKNLLK